MSTYVDIIDSGQMRAGQGVGRGGDAGGAEGAEIFSVRDDPARSLMFLSYDRVRVAAVVWVRYKHEELIQGVCLL